VTTESLLADIDALGALPFGWDGVSAEVPSPLALQEARDFARSCPALASILRARADVDGSVLLDVGDRRGGSYRFRGTGRLIIMTRSGACSISLDEVRSWPVQ
jgi:hypothetical protein